MTSPKTLFLYLNEHYSVKAEYLFDKHPEFAVFRHFTNKKWFALFMPVAGDKLGLSGKEMKNVLNLKLPPELIDGLRQSEGFYPAYHMNKQHWLSVDLGKIEMAELLPLIEQSYQLTK
ncbi:MmcQ/YjbR family DNA-binding protein [Gallibacterium anatis]|uniref:MmcQ/YjbR family DNA-binding protein n=1 Tax=Gallibacterium anatis TaxID=750 RepID=UPI00254A7BEA|nr:MmcQ/YjbR family DNA-binding protein [Gallibacterium anatis]WIM82614.1 MmcQ/YjbR family DNA-binding protein [Gallibacterium anatis]